MKQYIFFMFTIQWNKFILLTHNVAPEANTIIWGKKFMQTAKGLST